MAYRAPIFRPAGQQSRQEQKRHFDRYRRKAKPWRRFYDTAEWQALRTAQLIAEPYCERHNAKGEVIRASVVHHKTPHRGDWQLFVSSQLESLCKRCHDSEAQTEEAAARAREGE
jgi:5-methylcytosine-specific restriction enzyme A